MRREGKCVARDLRSAEATVRASRQVHLAVVEGLAGDHSAEIEPDPEMVVLDALSHKYTSQPFQVRFEGCVTLRITVMSCRHTVPSEQRTPPTAEAAGRSPGTRSRRSSPSP